MILNFSPAHWAEVTRMGGLMIPDRVSEIHMNRSCGPGPVRMEVEGGRMKETLKGKYV